MAITYGVASSVDYECFCCESLKWTHNLCAGHNILNSFLLEHFSHVDIHMIDVII